MRWRGALGDGLAFALPRLRVLRKGVLRTVGLVGCVVCMGGATNYGGRELVIMNL